MNVAEPKRELASIPVIARVFKSSSSVLPLQKSSATMEGRMFWLVSLLFSLSFQFFCVERRRQRPFLSFFLYLSLSRKNNPLTQSSINPIYINFSFPFLCFSPFFFVCVLVFGKEFGWWVFDLIQIAALQLVGCGGNGDLGGGF